MNPLPTPFFATVAGEAVSPWYKMSFGTREGIIVFAALVLLIVLLLTWAVFLRKLRLRRSRHQSRDLSPSAAVIDADDWGGAPKMRRKWRRRRRAHRPRNPTLAETGGLPPRRSDTPRDPSA
jgi:hypothetical protein